MFTSSRAILLITLLVVCALHSEELLAKEVTYHAQVQAETSQAPIEFLRWCQFDERHLAAFVELNELKSSRDNLKEGNKYRLPAYVRDYDGGGVRFALDIPMGEAVIIRDFNQKLDQAGVKPRMADDRKIWVPYDHVLTRAEGSETLSNLLSRFGLENQHISAFNQLNDFAENDRLKGGQLYRLPIHNVPYSGPTISASLDLTPQDAKRLSSFNKNAFNNDLKPQPWNDHLIWVPYSLKNNPTYGPVYQTFEVTSHQLQDCVFYLSPGHGGPDPGTSGTREGERICEDEYVLDITLRLARELEKQGADVVMAIDDEGIRDIKFLPCDKDETLPGSKKLSTDKVERLKQRVEPINKMHQVKGGHQRHQRFLALHIDFRPDNDKHVDFDVYHLGTSTDGEQLARSLQGEIIEYYDSRLGGREFVGRIKGQTFEDSFFVLRETAMPAVLVELANISNELDQLRFIVIDSRQRIANLLCKGLVEDWIRSGRAD